MGIYRGLGVVNDGLVFGYDTGYPISDNDTSTRFYPGEPTVNVLANTNPGYGGLTLGSDSGGTYILTSSDTSGYNYIKVPNITVSSNETYTWSFELKSEETITQSGNKYYFDTNEFSNEFSSSNDLSRVTWNQIRPSSLPAGEWVKFSLSVTMKPNLTGAYSYDFLNFIKPHFTSKKIYYRNMQFENNKSDHTPFVNGSRSDTASLIDLKRTTSLDVSDVSFDSNAQPGFDGTNDCIDLNDTLNSIGNLATFEMVFKATENNDTYRVMLGWGNGNSNYSGIHIGSWTSGYTDESFHISLNASAVQMHVRKGHTFYKDNKYHHAIVTAGQNNYSIWIDGVEQTFTFAIGSQSTSFNNIVGYNSNIVSHVGKRPYGGGSGYFKGEIPVMKVYDTILTETEIKQNYNAYKNRFNI